MPVDRNGIPVTFTCPNYGLFGNPSTYGSLSTSPTLGPDGRLGDAGALVSGRADPSAPGQCAVALGAGGSPPRFQETPGTYYWQVWRICTECPTDYESGPVRTLTLQSPVTPALSVPRKAYAGYGFFARPTARRARPEVRRIAVQIPLSRPAGSPPLRSVAARGGRRGRTGGPGPAAAARPSEAVTSVLREAERAGHAGERSGGERPPVSWR